MKSVIVLYLENELDDKKLSFCEKFIPQFLGKSLTSIEKINQIFFSVPKGYQGELSDKKEVFFRSEDSLTDWKELFKKTGADHIVKIYMDAFFIDNSIITEMLDQHLENLAEFTYSENLPAGFSCEIFSKELLNSIPETIENALPLEKVIKGNINQFDVELFYKSPDIRDLRISFRCSNLRDKKIMENIYKSGNNIPAYQDICNIIKGSPDILYIGPSFLEIELTANAQVTTVFSYRSRINRNVNDMDIALFQKIITDTDRFGLPYSICLGGAGDPLLYPNFFEALDFARKSECINNIVIETDGISNIDNFINYLNEKKDPRIKVIVDVNGYNQETYQLIHNADYFDKVYNNIKRLRDALDSNLYLQIMKINETENYLDKYYDFWEQEKVSIILQKQNVYLGLIENRRYYDLSPLERIPCWHLQCDLYILSTGDVVFCKQDINAEYSSVNISEKSIQDIWAEKRQNFLDNYNNNYAASPDCKSCDEWYTFNL